MLSSLPSPSSQSSGRAAGTSAAASVVSSSSSRTSGPSSTINSQNRCSSSSSHTNLLRAAAAVAGITTAAALVWRAYKVTRMKGRGSSSDDRSNATTTTTTAKTRQKLGFLRAAPEDIGIYEQSGLPGGSHGWKRVYGLLRSDGEGGTRRERRDAVDTISSSIERAGLDGAAASSTKSAATNVRATTVTTGGDVMCSQAASDNDLVVVGGGTQYCCRHHGNEQACSSRPIGTSRGFSGNSQQPQPLPAFPQLLFSSFAPVQAATKSPSTVNSSATPPSLALTLATASQAAIVPVTASMPGMSAGSAAAAAAPQIVMGGRGLGTTARSERKRVSLQSTITHLVNNTNNAAVVAGARSLDRAGSSCSGSIATTTSSMIDDDDDDAQRSDCQTALSATALLVPLSSSLPLSLSVSPGANSNYGEVVPAPSLEKRTPEGPRTASGTAASAAMGTTPSSTSFSCNQHQQLFLSSGSSSAPTNGRKQVTVAQQLQLLELRRSQQWRCTQALLSPLPNDSDGTERERFYYYTNIYSNHHHQRGEVVSDITAEVTNSRLAKLTSMEVEAGTAAADANHVSSGVSLDAKAAAATAADVEAEEDVRGSNPRHHHRHHHHQRADGKYNPRSRSVGSPVNRQPPREDVFTAALLSRNSSALEIGKNTYVSQTTAVAARVAVPSPRASPPSLAASLLVGKPPSSKAFALTSPRCSSVTRGGGATATAAMPPVGKSVNMNSQDRRVDDLRVQHKDGSEAYSISLTYHDTATGSSRTIDARALPPLTLPPRQKKSQPTAATGTTVVPQSSLSSTGAQAAKVAAAERPMSCASGTVSDCVYCAQTVNHWSAYDALRHQQQQQERSGALSSSGLTRRALAAAVRSTSETTLSQQRVSPAEAASADADGASCECQADDCRSAYNGNASSTTVTPRALQRRQQEKEDEFAAMDSSGFGAPLPPTEPINGPRLQGVAGRRGEMVIGAFLGGGACGKVYECLNKETGQVLAAKQIVFDAKDTKLRQRLKQLELELQVLTVAARHDMKWIVGFHGAEKRGHSVLMYLEYCAHGSLLDYMAQGFSHDAAMWATAMGEGSDAPAGVVAADTSVSAGGYSGSVIAAAAAAPPSPVPPMHSSGACTSDNGTAVLDQPLFSSSVDGASHSTTSRKEHQQQQQQQQSLFQAAHPTLEDDAARRYVRHDSSTPSFASSKTVTDTNTSHISSSTASLTTAAATTTTAMSMTLSDAMRPQMPPLSIDEVQRFTLQILLGLHFMHSHAYAHLDVKTANVLLTGSEECRLADLGCAMRMQLSPRPRRDRSGDVDTLRDRAGCVGEEEEAVEEADEAAEVPYPVLVDHEAVTELRGTALYMAPEMIRFEREKIGAPADVWSLGCVVMEMASGCAPWRHVARDKLRVLFRIGSARSDLPLPPLMTAWAAEAQEWLARDGGSENDDDDVVEEEERHDMVAASATAAAARRQSAITAVEVPVEPQRQRRHVEDSPAPSFPLFHTPDTAMLEGAHAMGGAKDETLSSAHKPKEQQQRQRQERRRMRQFVALDDFVTQCLRIRPEDRSSTEALLNHPFLAL